jgi:hypothetical protein
MHSRHNIKKAGAVFFALAIMITMSYCAFSLKQHYQLQVSALGKLSVSLLSLSLGFYLYAKMMQSQFEQIVCAWRYYVLLLSSDLLFANYLHHTQGIDLDGDFQPYAVLIGVGICAIYFCITRFYRFKSRQP